MSLSSRELIMKTGIMQILTNHFLLFYHFSTTSALKMIDNGLGPPVFGSEESIVDFAFLATDEKAALPREVLLIFYIEKPLLLLIFYIVKPLLLSILHCSRKCF